MMIATILLTFTLPVGIHLMIDLFRAQEEHPSH
ncbi:hypothetical protein LYSBPC_22960 [Lysinibacillus piscis]|uniref:Uncharacterized protein n=1 Tax=Lysinibacillus piscis TaxID=2518931 RepID=A0ABQ5NLE1_9BACI|nr:transcriptional regulator [Lysinibacillus sp. KH24]GLC89169.1 hypothetical protein LYSBPC_22960 [Lysinibacillus sp. KH24]